MSSPETLDDRARTLARQLRASLLGQLGLGSASLLLAAACTPTEPVGDEGGVTTNPSSDAGADSADDADADATGPLDEGAEDLDTGSEDPDTDESSDDGPKMDLGVKLDVPPDPECSVDWLGEDEAVVAELYPQCSFGPFDPNWYVEYFAICIEAPPGGDCASICPPGQLCEGMGPCFWGDPYEICGPFEDQGSCCLVAAGEPPPPIGRPFAVAGELRLASAAPVAGRLAAHWLDMARGEHASVAAFARFVASLQRFAAPPQLVRAALAAATDEVHHTELALALASRFAGRPLRLGGLAVDAALAECEELEAALAAAVLEGCIDETLAAHEAACLAACARDPQVAAALEQIAADEARHAALAWRFVAWALERAPQLRPMVAERFATRLSSPPDQSQGAPPTDTELLELGCAPPALRARWRELGLRELVAPCAARLLEGAKTVVTAEP